MNLFNFIFSEEDLIFSEEWQFYYILDILYPNTPNKILGENNEINNFSSIRNFKFSFNKSLSVLLIILLFYFGSLRNALAAPSSLRMGSALTIFKTPGIAFSSEMESSENFNKPFSSQALVNFNVKTKKSSSMRRRFTSCVTGRASNSYQDQLIINFQSFQQPPEVLLSACLTTQVPIILTPNELALKINEKSAFFVKDPSKGNFSFVVRKSSNERFQELTKFYNNGPDGKRVGEFFTMIRDFTNNELNKATSIEEQNDAWHKLIALKNISSHTKPSLSLKTEIKKFPHLNQPELKREINTVLKQDLLDQASQSQKVLTKKDFQNDPTLFERYLVEDSAFAHALVKGRYVSLDDEKTVVVEGIENPKLTYMHKNLINIKHTYEFVQNKLDRNRELLNNIKTSFANKQDFSLTETDAREYLDMFKELNNSVVTRFILNNPHERISDLTEIKQYINKKNIVGNYSFLDTVDRYLRGIEIQKNILNEQIKVITGLLNIVDSAVSHSKQLSLKAYEMCLQAETDQVSNKNFVFSTSLFCYAPGAGPGCVDSGIAQQELLNSTYSQLDEEINKVASHQTVVPELYHKLKEEAKSISNMDYSTFRLDDNPKIDPTIAVIFDPSDTVIAPDTISFDNPGLPSRAEIMQRNVYYILNDNSLVSGKFIK